MPMRNAECSLSKAPGAALDSAQRALRISAFMTPRPLGATGALVSPIAFGAMRIIADRDGTSSVLLHALERGVATIDTARNYGDSEAIVGRTLREWRGPRPFIATKVKPKDVSNWRLRLNPATLLDCGSKRHFARSGTQRALLLNRFSLRLRKTFSAR